MALRRYRPLGDRNRQATIKGSPLLSVGTLWFYNITCCSGERFGEVVALAEHLEVGFVVELGVGGVAGYVDNVVYVGFVFAGHVGGASGDGASSAVAADDSLTGALPSGCVIAGVIRGSGHTTSRLVNQHTT